MKSREVELSRKLDHGNICKLFAFFYEYESPHSSFGKASQRARKYLHLIMEYIPYSLCDVIEMFKERGTKLPMRVVKSVARDIFSGLSYIHSMGICHRDIKPQNMVCRI